VACPGESIQLNVQVDPGQNGISGGEIEISFDPSFFQVIDVAPGDLLGANPLIGTERIDNNAGNLIYALARVGQTPVPTSSGTFAVIQLDTVSTEVLKACQLLITKAGFCNEQFEDISNISCDGATIEIVEGPSRPSGPGPIPEPGLPLTAADIPELSGHVARGQVWGHLLWNPFEGLLVKPDGTPYKVAYTVATGEAEQMAQAMKMMEDFFPRFGLGEKGYNWTIFDPVWNADAQIRWFEDMCATFKPDWIMCHAVDVDDEGPTVPVIESCIYEYGIPVFTFDRAPKVDGVTSFVAHKAEGPGGSDIIGEWIIDDLRRRGYGPRNPVVVGELWGMRDMKDSHMRHAGFHWVVDRQPWITLIESADTNWAEEQTATITADIIIAHPEIKALFHHGAGATGIISGLESIRKLLPVGHPDHITITSNDLETVIWDSIIDGRADAVAWHSGVEPSDTCFQLAIYNVILGQPVEGFYQLPYIMVDATNIDTVQIGGVPPYPGWPRNRWDVWLPADPEPDYGFPQPTLELRNIYMGY